MYRGHNPESGPHYASPSSQVHYVASQSIVDLLMGSLFPVVVGVILILGGSSILFWNEGQAVDTTRILDEGYNSVIHVQSTDLPLKENNNKLVHVSGILWSDPPLVDDYYGIEINSVHLKRRVQLFQWIEETRTASEEMPESIGGSSYSYSKAWLDKIVDSSSFFIPWGHENPKSFSVRNAIIAADTVKVGEYFLSSGIKKTFRNFLPFSGDEQPPASDLKLHAGMYYTSKDVFEPEIGDIRIQFYYAGHAGEVVSIVAQQIGNSLHPFMTMAGKELLIIRSGKLSIEDMFSSEHTQHRFYTWALRLGGWFFMFIGMTAVSHIIHTFVTHSHLLRNVVALGLGSASLTLSTSTALVIIGGAWLFYRPGLAFFILIVATLPFLRAAAKHGKGQRLRDHRVHRQITNGASCT